MTEKRTASKVSDNLETADNYLRNKNHLKFFVDRSSETVERTLGIIQKLQQEINQLKDGLAKADNEFRNLNQLVQGDKKTKN